MPAARQMALMFRAELLGMLRLTSEPGRIAVDVAVAVALGRVAVCAPVPILTKATFGPSLTMRILFPEAGSAVDALAVAVTEIGSVRLCALKGSGFISNPL